MTLHELIVAGGPEAMARQAAERAAQQERRLWLDVLEDIQQCELDLTDTVYVALQISNLRRRLGIGQPKDVIRAQTRERVRQYRIRQRERATGTDHAIPKVLNIHTIGGEAAKAMIADGTAVYIGGRCGYGAWPQSEWANTYRPKRYGRAEVIKRYRERKLPAKLADVPKLRGKVLLCWCAPEPCHGDLLLELANR